MACCPPGVAPRRPSALDRPERPHKRLVTLFPCCSSEGRRPLIEGRRHARFQAEPLAKIAWKPALWNCSMRKASIKRTTKETAIEVAVDLDGSGTSSVSTGI